MYETIMFATYLTGAIAMAAMNLFFDWAWKREFCEPRPASASGQGWTISFIFLTVALGWLGAML